MPTYTNRRGVGRWRGVVKIKGKIVASKWFGEGKNARSDPEYKKAFRWEEEEKAKLKSQSQSHAQFPIPSACLRVIDWANEYLEYAKEHFVEKTVAEKVATFRLFVRFIGPETAVEGISPHDALKFIQLQRKARSAYAANKERKNLAAAWTWGRKFVEAFSLDVNPFLVVPRYPEERHDRYVPPEADFWKVLDAAEGQDRVMLMTFLHLAARRGEVFRMKWDDIDFPGNSIRLWTRKNKNGSWRGDWLPMTQELRTELLHWWEHRENKDSEFVFTVADRTPFTNQHQGKPFKVRQHFMQRLCLKAGVKPFGLHAIRHLSAIILYHKLGCQRSIVQAILRHQQATTTEIYLKQGGLAVDEMRDAVEALSHRKSGKLIQIDRKEKALGIGISEG